MKKRFVVISNQGTDDCSHNDFDTMKAAEVYARGAAGAAANVHRPLEYAIYEKVAITNTHLVSVDIERLKKKVSA